LHGFKSNDFVIKTAFTGYYSTEQQKPPVNLFIWMLKNKFDEAATEFFLTLRRPAF